MGLWARLKRTFSSGHSDEIKEELQFHLTWTSPMGTMPEKLACAWAV
jgi:hypothetical protein